MDETKKGLLLGALALSFLQFACKDKSSSQRIFEESKSGCYNQVIPNEYVVQWKDGLVTVEQGHSKEEFKKGFVERNLEHIQIVEENQIIKVPRNFSSGLQTSSSVFNEEDVLWGVNSINAPSAWNQGLYGSYEDENGDEKPIVVAVIDDGMDLFHKKLQEQIYYNEGEIGFDENGDDKRYNGVDDDNNNFVDDFAGYNFDNDTGLVDASRHGTHVSGIIVAQHDEFSSTVKGVAPAAKILPLDFMGSRGGSISAAVGAIDYAVMRGAKVINASWGGSQCSAILEQKINGLSTKNILFIAASGNEGRDIDIQFVYPASFDAPSLLVVGSVQRDLIMAGYSNYGEEHVDVFAPGSNIVSTVGDSNNQKTEALSGTSMATPFVAGTAALLWGAAPNATSLEIKEAILKGIVEDSFYKNSTKGRVDVGLALDSLLNGVLRL